MRASTSLFGIVVSLTHDEVEKYIRPQGEFPDTEEEFKQLAEEALAIGALGVATPVAGVIAAVLKVYIRVQSIIILPFDKGYGVDLTIPWTAIPTLSISVIIPRTIQPPVDADWMAGLDDGYLRTEDSDDLIHFTVQHNVVEREGAVAFILVNNTGSDKNINMPDGLGASWDIRAGSGGGTAENGLGESDCQNGQALTFANHIVLGFWDDVLSLRGLERLRANDVVTFFWDKD